MNDLHFAVVVGIELYPGIGNLTAAHADAEDFYKWVTSPDGGGVPKPDRQNRRNPEGNATLVLAELPPGASDDLIQPTRDKIYGALERYKARARAANPVDWPQTRLYFYGAGHGIAPEARDTALLAANARRDSLGRHVSCVSLLEFFSRVQLFRELALFADCCRTSATGTVPRMPVEWTDDPVNNGSVRKFLACGAIFSRQAFEEMDRPPDERRGYFTRALMDGLRRAPTAIDPASSRITSTCLKGHITEHMRRATEGKFRTPLEPDFVDEGTGEVIFGAPAAAQAALPRHPVRLEVRSVAVTGLNVVAFGSSAAPVPTTRSAPDSTVFECALPVGLYEAVPLGVPPRPAGQEWLFKVIEGGVSRAF